MLGAKNNSEFRFKSVALWFGMKHNELLETKRAEQNEMTTNVEIYHNTKISGAKAREILAACNGRLECTTDKTTIVSFASASYASTFIKLTNKAAGAMVAVIVR